MKIKRIISLLSLAFISTLVLSSCGKEDNISVKVESIPFHNGAKDFYDMKATSINTYYVDNSSIKYCDVGEFMVALDGLYKTQYFNRSISRMRNVYNIYAYANTGNSLETLSATIDWVNDTITISNPMFFNLINSPSSVDFMAHINQKDVDSGTVEAKVFNLKDYGFNIYYKNGKCLAPFSVLNTIFASNVYYNIYYTGEKYVGLYFDLSAYDEESKKTIKTNVLNNQAQTEELREETYNHLRFLLDNFYGLKEYKNISNFDEILSGYKEDIMSLDPEVNADAYYKLFVNYFDELHTRMGAYSFYLTPENTVDNWDLAKTSQARINYKATEEKLKNLSKDIYTEAEPTYRIYDETAIIYLPSFTTGSTEDIQKTDGYKKDSYEAMLWALKNIEEKNVKNIVLDLSLNGGGNLAALFRVLGFMSNDTIDYVSYNPMFKSKSKIGIDIDINADNDYTDADAYSNYNWYVLSGLTTFSAANSCTAMAKSLGAKVIGQKSGGGMCSVFPIVLADSTTVEISGPDCQMASINNEDVFIEGGVDADIKIDYEYFYNIEYINSLLTK